MDIIDIRKAILLKKFIVILLVAVTLISVCFAVCNQTDGNLKNYREKRNKIGGEDILPELDSLPEYKTIAYRYQNKYRILYDTATIFLVVTYDEDTYAEEKEEMEKQYVFLNKDSFAPGYKRTDSVAEYEFSINSYCFHVIADSKSTYPKFFGMVAASDEKHSIAYLYYNDVDLDYTGDMANFVRSNYTYHW